MSDLESLLRRVAALLLLGFHSVPSAVFIWNPLIGMVYPVAIEWLLLSPWSPFYYFWETRWLVFDKVSIPNLYCINPNAIVGWSLFAVGTVIFLVAFVQFLQNRKKGFVETGLYSKIRHPQYLGIILATLGFTFTSERPMAWIAWFNLVFLYLLLASGEENIIQKDYEEKFQTYKRQVPFILPLLWFPFPKSRSKKYLAVFLIYLVTLILAWTILRQLSYNPGPFWK